MNNLLASFIFFTRLPFWRIKEVPTECFKHVVTYWPIVGWLTGGITVLTLWACGQIVPVSLAWIIALLMRLLITGAMHEDGLADFMDGFGGGMTRERVLAIMKDSHIGTYGVLGLIIYYCLMMQMSMIPLNTLCVFVLCGDCWSKCVASNLSNLLPYARKEEESKAKMSHPRMSFTELVISFIGGILPTILLLPHEYYFAMLSPIIVFFLLCMLIKRRIQGYTGDCCGTVFLLCELSFYLSCFVLWRLH